MGPEEQITSDVSALRYAKPLRDEGEGGTDENLTKLAAGMLVRAGFPCRCEVMPGEYRLVKIVTDDASAGMLIGRHGQTVDAVEHLVERMAHTVAGERVFMNLDINNYRRRREESLVDRAADAVSSVRNTGEEFHMEPMNARERRIVHLEAEQAGLHTRTEFGQGGKHVVISAVAVAAAEEAEPETMPEAAPAPEASFETAQEEAPEPTSEAAPESAPEEAPEDAPEDAAEDTAEEEPRADI